MRGRRVAVAVIAGSTKLAQVEKGCADPYGRFPFHDGYIHGCWNYSSV